MAGDTKPKTEREKTPTKQQFSILKGTNCHICVYKNTLTQRLLLEDLCILQRSDKHCFMFSHPEQHYTSVPKQHFESPHNIGFNLAQLFSVQETISVYIGVGLLLKMKRTQTSVLLFTKKWILFRNCCLVRRLSGSLVSLHLLPPFHQAVSPLIRNEWLTFLW